MSHNQGVPGWMDLAFRVGAGLVTAWFVYRVVNAFSANTSRYILLPLLLSELISLCTIIFARRASFRDFNPAYVAVTLIASFAVPLLISLQEYEAIIPSNLSVPISNLGILWQIYGKLSLGRSFGLLPARRAIKVYGAYRFMRHPIYVGYFINHLGFLLSNFGPINLVLLVGLYTLQILRALREEKILMHDDAYRLYCQQVPYRFVYGLF